MARSKKNENTKSVLGVFHHGTSNRPNIPEATETQAGLSKGKKQQYRYNPHLAPNLRFDTVGLWDRVKLAVAKAIAGQKLSDDEAGLLKFAAAQGETPWLEWAGKSEQHSKGSFSVDDVVLHIHERISAQAIAATARREAEPEQDLFARPKLHREQALQYYRHSMEWANRIVLGDSLQVMSSLASREALSGQVQMIYFDPPYGIKFSSNWQNEVANKSIGETDEDLCREPEVIKAYRDTWSLGVHSYLSYIKQRLVIAHSLLKNTGSIFVQISDENLHRVRLVLDEVFGSANFCARINVVKTAGQTDELLSSVADSLLWYAKDKESVKYHRLRVKKGVGFGEIGQYYYVEENNGERRRLRDEEIANWGNEKSELRPFRISDITSNKFYSLGKVDFEFEGQTFIPSSGRYWTHSPDGRKRLALAGRLMRVGNSARYTGFLDDDGYADITNQWSDTGVSGFGADKLYVVQTSTKVIERCVLMTTDPGDLVVDPTCGSGSTAYVAEQWGRRWITIDSSRVAVAIARQRLLTALFDSLKTKDPASGVDPAAPQNPGFGFVYKNVPYITLKSIAQNRALDSIIVKHEPIIKERLEELNRVLTTSLKTVELVEKLVNKLRVKVESEGVRAIRESDLRRWLLPTTPAALIVFGTPSQRKNWRDSIPQSSRWQEWEVPFDSDTDWPVELQNCVRKFREAWTEKMEEVTKAIQQNAEQEELVDQPEVVRGVSRVSGPFTVEGVRPEELALGEDGKVFDPTANNSDDVGSTNADSYIDLMVGLIRKDGVTFLGNRRAEFANLIKEAGRGFHARGRWKEKGDDLDNVAVFFGPQYGPVNAPMMREAIEGAQWLKEVDELVVAGFSFDSAAQEVAKEKSSDKLRIHLAHIRPDVSPGMQGLLKETANSQLFTVFGQPDISVVSAPDGMKQVKMSGVCVYNPLTGEITEASAKKVAAWFLDTDYDGRCFCVSQAFFPDKEAWAKIAKALGSSVSEGAFEDSTISWPFKVGKHKRIAVKVIDPRGNEVMAIKTLNA